MIVRPMTPRVVNDRGQDIPLPRGTRSILIPEDTDHVDIDRETDEIIFVVRTGSRTEPRGKVLETQAPLAGSDLDSHIVLSYD